MNNKLYEWLRREFYFSNHSKYRHLFEEWVSNITSSQIEGFSKQMYNKENNILGIKEFSKNWVIIEEPIKPYYPKFPDFTSEQLESAKDIEIIFK